MGFHEQHRQGLNDLNEFWNNLALLEEQVRLMPEGAPDFVRDQIERIQERLEAFEPTISVIGQIKAGKSSLVNALVGQPDLLPSDVNPWTSVITSLHLNAHNRPPNTRALFRFFDAQEWDRLVESGGRLGEMAKRAGFEGEYDTVKTQVEAMRRNTEERLGDEFQALLGTSRAFPEIDKSIIDRYICYGDPDDLKDGGNEGVYADLTKQADLYVDLPGFPTGICIRDTPGVNDTFMMREQITLNAISESRMCVVVLSAHQALSTMDMALMRIICAIDSREVVIFINRIDELTDPEVEVPQIEANIRKTLGRFGLDSGIEILSGSGYWARMAVMDDCAAMLDGSRAALEKMLPGSVETLRERALDASGIGALQRAIAKRVIEGPGAALAADVAAQLSKIEDMQKTLKTVAPSEGGVAISPAEISRKLVTLRTDALGRFDAGSEQLRASLKDRLDRARDQFTDNAIDALQSHIDAFGEIDNWSHDPATLRMIMRSSYVSATTKLRRLGVRAMEEIAENIGDLLLDDLFVQHDTADIDFPQQPLHRPPANLAKTLSLDLEGTWWRKFWKFGMKSRAEKRYRGLIEAEVSPLIDELIGDYFDEAVVKSRDLISTFVEEQGQFVFAVVGIAAEGDANTQMPDLPSDGKVTKLPLKKRSAA